MVVVVGRVVVVVGRVVVVVATVVTVVVVVALSLDEAQPARSRTSARARASSKRRTDMDFKLVEPGPIFI